MTSRSRTRSISVEPPYVQLAARMSLVPPTGRNPVNNPVTATDEPRDGGMSVELSLNAAVAEVASEVVVK
jgi:hypothetical protein